MKKVFRLSILFGSIALILLLAISIAAADEAEMGPDWADLEFWPVPHPLQGEAGQEASAESTATRINFEQSEDSAMRGWYVVQEVDGPYVAAWYAYDGWQDSGWINHLYITHDSVWVKVLYFPPGSTADTEPTVMKILNHAPKKEYGWLTQGAAHALEVEFPD